MKKIFLIIIFLLSNRLSYSQKVITNKNFYYDFSFNLKTFNEKNNSNGLKESKIILIEIKDKDTIIDTLEVAQYNKKGQLTDLQIKYDKYKITYNKDKISTIKTNQSIEKFTYKKGILTKIEYFSNFDTTKHIFNYNRINKDKQLEVTEIYFFGNNDTVYTYYHYIFYNNGILKQKKIISSSKNRRKQEFFYQYDPKGELLVKNEYYYSTQDWGIDKNTGKKKNRIKITEISYKKDISESTLIDKRTHLGNDTIAIATDSTITKDFYYNNQIVSSIRYDFERCENNPMNFEGIRSLTDYFYDAKGNLIKEKKYEIDYYTENRERKLTTTKYEYKNNNLLYKTITYNNNKRYKYIYQYEYYDKKL